MPFFAANMSTKIAQIPDKRKSSAHVKQEIRLCR
jgi:hypothetical protein